MNGLVGKRVGKLVHKLDHKLVHKHEDRVHGVLSCFDRMRLRGHATEQP